MPDSPKPPLTELAAAAVQQHELYQSWIDAGFTEEQAMQLLVAILCAGVGSAS